MATWFLLTLHLQRVRGIGGGAAALTAGYATALTAGAAVFVATAAFGALALPRRLT